MASTHVAFTFSPDIWDDFFTSYTLDTKLMETYVEEVGILKEQVRALLDAAGAAATQSEKMNLIDTLERLGVSYHFHEEIEEIVGQMFREYDCKHHYDLCTVALHFRIFRQHCHKISTDVFMKFKDEKGQFLESLSSDTSGMLSLYEAANLRTHGEDILEEALSFTKIHLTKSLEDQEYLSPFLAKQVRHALGQALHRGFSRIEARHYIDVYQDHDSRNDTILRLAKIDFNRLQLLYQHELSILTRNWKDLGLVMKGSHARYRAVESYFWASTAYFEPQFGLARLIFAKSILLVTFLDDTYDEYGTFEELQVLTNAILQWWDVTAAENLPDNMKPVYKGVLKVFDEFEVELAEQGVDIHYAKQAIQIMARGYFTEVKWHDEGYTPTIDEYLRNSLETTNEYMVVTALMGLGKEVATKEAFEWSFSKPKIGVASSLVARLLNDITHHKDHRNKGNRFPTSVDCYMKQYKVSKQEAIDELYKRSEDAWKDINEELLVLWSSTNVSNCLLMVTLNLTRAIDVIYKDGHDGFTHPQGLQDIVKSLYVNPIHI